MYGNGVVPLRTKQIMKTRVVNECIKKEFISQFSLEDHPHAVKRRFQLQGTKKMRCTATMKIFTFYSTLLWIIECQMGRICTTGKQT